MDLTSVDHSRGNPGPFQALFHFSGIFLNPVFCTDSAKTVHFYTLFSNVLFPLHSGKTGQFTSGYETLMYAIGWQNGRWLGGWRVTWIKMAVLGNRKILLFSCEQTVEKNFILALPEVYPERGNPGPLRAQFPCFFCFIVAKNRTLLHIILKMWCFLWIQAKREVAGRVGHLDKKGCFGAW